MSFESDVVFGEGGHLPGAEVLREHEIDWINNRFQGRSRIVESPDDPNTIIRLQRTGHTTPEELTLYMNESIQHLSVMRDFGITIPPLRFVITAAQRQLSDKVQLYIFIDRLQGRDLTPNPEDGIHASPIIKSIADYCLWAHQTEQTRFLWDKMWAQQYTVRHDIGQAVLHDVGLDFRPVHDTDNRNNGYDIRYSAWCLQSWSERIDCELPDDFQDFLKTFDD